jgi:hypothetical protein
LLQLIRPDERFSHDRKTRKRTKEFFQYAKEAFQMNLLDISLENIQASVLVGNLCGAEGEPKQESLFFGTDGFPFLLFTFNTTS